MQDEDNLRGEQWAKARLDDDSPISFPDSWPAGERTLSGAFAANAIVGDVAKGRRSALRLENARITGSLELESVSIAAELCFRLCTFCGPVHFRETSFAHRVRFIDCIFESAVEFDACSGSDLWFVADLELAEGTAIQPGAGFGGTTSFLDSKFSGNLVCDNAHFRGTQEVSLNGTTVGGSVLMRSAEFSAGATFLGLRVGYSFNAEGAKFLHASEAVTFSASRIANGLYLSNAEFHGPASFETAQIGVSLFCQGVRFLNVNATTSFNSIDVGGDARFDDATFLGLLEFVAAKIKGTLVMTRAKFLHEGTAATFNSARIGGHTLLSEAEVRGSFAWDAAAIDGTADFSRLKVLQAASAATFSALKVEGHGLFTESVFCGPVSFVGASFQESFDATGAEFHSASDIVDFSSTTIDAHSSFAKAKFHGPVNLSFARIGGTLSFASAEFLGSQPINLESIHAQNIVWFVDARFHGPVSIAQAEIGGDLRCDRSHFLSETGLFNAMSLKVKGHAYFLEAEFHGSVYCGLLEVGGNLVGDRARFANADQTIDFSFARIRGSLQLLNTNVHGTASFMCVRIDGNAAFNDAEFGSRVSFHSARIDGWALFNRSRFARTADMPYIAVASSLEFRGAQFQESLLLTSARLGGSLLLSPEPIDEEPRDTVIVGELDLFMSEVKGNLRFNGLECHGRARFARMSAMGDAAFSGAKFYGIADFHSFTAGGTALFDGTRFHQVATFDYLATGHLNFSRAWFADKASFDNARVKGRFSLLDVEFVGSASLQQCIVEEDLDFTAGTTGAVSGTMRVNFHSKLNADGITVNGTLTLRDLRFDPSGNLTLSLATIGILCVQESELADLTCYAARIGNGILFTNNTVHGDASFACTKVGGRTQFDGSHFLKSCNLDETELLGYASFNATQDFGKESEKRICAFDGRATFAKTRFGGELRFNDTAFGSEADFRAAQFLGETRFGKWDDAQEHELIGAQFAKDATFDHAVFAAPAWFLGVRFGGRGLFSKTQFQSRVMFSDVHFTDEADRSAVFSEAHFQGQALFRYVHVNGRLAFYGCKSSHHLRISTSCLFAGQVDFENSSLTLLDIEWDVQRVPDYSFLGELTLAGCSYQRIKCPSNLGLKALWDTLKNNLARRERSDDSSAFDRQPFLRFEQFCRSVGENELADSVYFDMRLGADRRESRRLYKLWNAFERGVFGYGVLPARIGWWFIAIWIAGAVIYALPADIVSAPAQIMHGLRASLSNLVPGVSELLKGDPRTTSDTLIGVVAVLQRLAGWMLLALLAHKFFKGLKR